MVLKKRCEGRPKGLDVEDSLKKKGYQTCVRGMSGDPKRLPVA